MNKIDNMGAYIKRKRIEKNLTCEKLALLLGVSKGTVSKWERGEIENIRNDKINMLATILDVSPLTFIKNEEIPRGEMITANDFKKEVEILLSKVQNLTYREKEKILSDIEFICGGDK